MPGSEGSQLENVGILLSSAGDWRISRQSHCLSGRRLVRHDRRNGLERWQGQNFVEISFICDSETRKATETDFECHHPARCSRRDALIGGYLDKATVTTF